MIDVVVLSHSNIYYRAVGNTQIDIKDQDDLQLQNQGGLPLPVYILAISGVKVM